MYVSLHYLVSKYMNYMKMHKVRYSDSDIPPSSYAYTCCQEGVAFRGNKQSSWGDCDRLLFFTWIAI